MFVKSLVEATFRFPDVNVFAARALYSVYNAILLGIRYPIFNTTKLRELVRRKENSDIDILLEVSSKFPFQDPCQILTILPQVGECQTILWLPG